MGRNGRARRGAASLKFVLTTYVMFFGVYALVSPGRFYSGDTEQKLRVAESIVAGEGVLLKSSGWWKRPDGLTYSQFPIGHSLLFVPFVAVGRALGHMTGHEAILAESAVASVLNPLATAGCCTIIVVLLAGVGYPLRASLVTAMLIGFATIVAPYAKTGWTEPVCALCLVGGVGALAACQRGAGLAAWAAAGICAGVLPTLRLEQTAVALVLVGAGCGILWLRRGGADGPPRFIAAALLVLPLLLGVCLDLWYNVARTGEWLNFGYVVSGGAEPAAPGERVFHYRRAYVAATQLISPGKGLIVYSPAVLPALWGWRAFLGRPIGRLALALVIATVLMLWTLRAMTSWAWGPRYLVPIVPLVALPLVEIVTRWREASGARRAVTVALVIAGVTINLVPICVSHQFIFEAIHRDLGKPDVETFMAAVRWSPRYAPLVYGIRLLPEHGANSLRVATGQTPSRNPTELMGAEDGIHRHVLDFWWVYALLFGAPPVVVAGALAAAAGVTAAAAAGAFRALRAQSAAGQVQ